MCKLVQLENITLIYTLNLLKLSLRKVSAILYFSQLNLVIIYLSFLKSFVSFLVEPSKSSPGSRGITMPEVLVRRNQLIKHFSLSVFLKRGEIKGLKQNDWFLHVVSELNISFFYYTEHFHVLQIKLIMQSSLYRDAGDGVLVW